MPPSTLGALSIAQDTIRLVLCCPSDSPGCCSSCFRFERHHVRPETIVAQQTCPHATNLLRRLIHSDTILLAAHESDSAVPGKTGPWTLGSDEDTLETDLSWAPKHPGRSIRSSSQANGRSKRNDSTESPSCALMKAVGLFARLAFYGYVRTGKLTCPYYHSEKKKKKNIPDI
ncbi:hypothetical protein NOR_02107 [Metarhizium rileyi]|uniref:Uncharacterized protein n=1 Tax=Metarhizium rileyi (strain RCEF 4871) TaxID=1649241 RepID=A0A167H8P6_METRR|nr:hypothetical protein NOR_02107 [Metarhizium rileyi RCEF 4871]